ncbi:MAG: hypothetical protein ACLP3C_00675 [Mycobacterium sp.]
MKLTDPQVLTIPLAHAATAEQLDQAVTPELRSLGVGLHLHFPDR